MSTKKDGGIGGITSDITHNIESFPSDAVVKLREGLSHQHLDPDKYYRVDSVVEREAGEPLSNDRSGGSFKVLLKNPHRKLDDGDKIPLTIGTVFSPDIFVICPAGASGRGYTEPPNE